jgi:hypothetical protein
MKKKEVRSLVEDLICKAMKIDRVKIGGKWQIVCTNNGIEQWQDSGKNLVVTVGLNHIADQLSGTPGEAAMGWMAGGTSSAATAAGQTALQGAELARVALDSSVDSTNTVDYVATFGAGVGTGTWEEVGLFNAGGAGTMLDRLLTGTKVKNAGDTFTVTITLTITAS